MRTELQSGSLQRTIKHDNLYLRKDIDIMKKLMLGNEAFARGLYEAGCRVVSSYPGTPSTEITEEVAKYGS